MRNIIVASSQGFCWGVRKALDKVEEYGEVSILGDLIHNKQVVQKLANNGKKIIHELEPENKNPIVITAHGAPIESFQKLEQVDNQVIDTTCPLVSVIYKKGALLEKEGYQIVIIGDKNHIEVKGIASRMKKPIVVNSLEDIEKTNFPDRVGIVCQSTYLVEKFETMVEKIKAKTKEVNIKNTICSPTVKRQVAAEDLAQKVDVMIVVGGYHSSNTKKLAELSKKKVTTYHVETCKELQKSWFDNKQEIGITAGASTPDWIIEEVRSTIANFP